MANNTVQTGADTIRTQDRSGVKTTIVALDLNPGGSESLASPTNPMAVNIAASGAAAAQTSQALTASAASTLAGATSTSGSWVLDAGPAGNASFELVATAFVGTVVFEQSYDAAGANGRWAAVAVMPEDSTAPLNTLAINTAVAYVRQFSLGMLGPKLFRVRCSAFTSGTLTVTGSGGPGWYEGQPSIAAGTAVIGAVSMAAATAYAVTTVNTSGTTNTNTVLLAADSTRKGLLITNRSTTALLVGFGTTTTTSLYSVSIPSGQTYDVPEVFAPAAINGMTTATTQPVNFTAAT